MKYLSPSLIFASLVLNINLTFAASNIARDNSYNCDLVDVHYNETISEDIEFRLREEAEGLNTMQILTTPSAHTKFFNNSLYGLVKSCSDDSCQLVILDQELNKKEFTLENPQVPFVSLILEPPMVEYKVKLICRDHARDTFKRERDRIEDQVEEVGKKIKREGEVIIDQAEEAAKKLEREAKRIREQAKEEAQRLEEKGKDVGKKLEDGIKKLF